VTDPASPQDRLAGLSREQRAFLFEQIRKRKEKERAAVPEGIPRRPPGLDPLPLSFGQERLWFLDRLELGNTAFNMGSSLRLRGRLDAQALERALNEVVARHESLRTTFAEAEGLPAQRIAPSLWVPLAAVDLSGLPAEAREAESGRAARVSLASPYDLAAGPLVRAALLCLDPDLHVFLLDVHHIVSDGWSAGVMNRELVTLYEAFAAGEPSPLPPLAIQYGDFAHWQRQWLRGEALEAQLAYWRGKLGGGLAPLDLPTDRPRPAVQTFQGGSLQLRVGAETGRALRALTRQREASLFMTLLAAFKALLARLSGQDDVVVGSPIAGRRHVETESLIGFFLNTLALRTRLAGDPPFRELLDWVRETTLGAFSHQDVPFEALLAEIKPERDLSRTPVFQVFFNMLNFPSQGARLRDLEIDLGPVPEPESKFDLTLYAVEEGDEILVQLVYNAGLFGAPRMAELLRQYRTVLETVARDPGRRIGDLPLVTPEAALLLPDLSRPLAAGWPGAVHERFLAHARRHPRRVAAADEHGVWTWEDLDAQSGRLAARLLAAGVGEGEPVAVWAYRAAPLAAALLGVLRAGAAFVLLDPAYPPARLAAVVKRVRPRAWIDVPGAGPLPGEIESLFGEIPRLRMEGPGRSADPEAPCAAVHPDAPAWIAFTSGSTGEPKGIVGTHRPLSHFLEWHEATFGLGETDRFSLLSGLAHDPLLRDVFAPLWSGGELRVPPSERLGEPGWLAGWFAREGITVAHLTPAMARLLASGESGPLRALRLVASGGEALTGGDVELLRRIAPNALLVNFYGATETPQAMGWKVVEEPACQVPLGKGIEGVDLLMLARSGGLAGIGELGEVCVRTPYLAQGYLDDPAGTAKRFVPAPGGARLYRTGDLGRYGPDGDVSWAGRADRQLKIRGFRVEPAEIEAAIQRLCGVRASVVVPRDGQLTAYVVPAPGAGPDLAGRLRAGLAAGLPDYMVPAVFVELDEIPLTPNGKVDRRALPAPRRPEQEAGTGPRNPVEEKLAGLWAELLRQESVGVHDNFFELGGHSLLATQLVSRIRAAFGVEVSLRRLFENPILERLAAVISPLTGAAPDPAGTAIPRRPPGLDPVPASFAQERLWFLDRLVPGNRAYHIAKALRLLGGVSPARLEAALGAVVRRHESLRTTFVERDGQPAQAVSPPGPWSLPQADLSGLPADRVEGEARRLAQESAARPFDLARGPLLRTTLLRLAPGEEESTEHALLLAMHHVVSDGWSMGVLVHELITLYVAAATGRPAVLPELPIQYSDFAVWQRAWLRDERLEEQIAYWRERLAGAPDLAIPTDRPRSPVPDPRGGRVRVELPRGLGRELAALSRRQDATLFMTLFAVFHTLLVRYTGQDDFVLGTGVANRVRREIEPLIGFFVNALALRAGLPGDPSFLDLLASVRHTTVEAYTQQDLPFERLVEELKPERKLTRNPLFQVSLALHNTPEVELHPLPGITFAPLEFEAPGPVFDLEAHFFGGEADLFAEIGYRSDLFDEATVRRLGGHLERLLAGVAEDPARRLSELPLLPEAERHQLLHEWNDTAVTDGGAFRDIAGLVAEQVRRSPGALALAHHGRRLTYAEMDARAERLARLLASLGVGPETLVGLHVERSPEMVIGALAILKAGAAYVPLDPDHPEKRLSHIAAETRMPVVLTRGSGLGWAGGAVEVKVDEKGEAGRDGESPAASPESTAYVIYTSGSTGRPKGVPISHAGLLNMVRWQSRSYGFAPGLRMAQVMAPGFDAAVGEIWPSLASGASLHIADEEARLSPDRMLAWLAAEGIGLCVLPTALGELVLELAERGAPPGLALRTLMVGGDRLKRFPSPALPFPVANNYGPTEAAMVATWSPVERAGEPAAAPPHLPAIGRPVDNARVHVLDRFLHALPAGIPGELAIGGPGLSRGYLGRPDQTAERFIPDPFSAAPGERLYRTGDRVRRRPDGRLDFLERIDDQVKIRGFRIELGEIERVLERHPQVSEAVVMIRAEGEATGPRLAAYVVRRDEADRGGGEDLAHVEQWQNLYDEAYVPDLEEAADPTFDIRGWNSSYTGGPIPPEEMREWVESTVERILALHPRRVLEIGCGTGLLLFRVAPSAELYLGTDFSSVALGGIRRQLHGLPQVELRQAMAHEVAAIAPDGLDLVVLNSVAQYFPGVDYLVNVLEGAVRAVGPGGAVFVGDVRSLPLLQAFHASVELFQAPDSMPLAELRSRIARRLADEEELAVDPRFFFVLARRLPQIKRVEILVKRGSAHNELTRFRYDVVLRLGEAPAVPPGPRHTGLDLPAIERLLAAGPEALTLTDLPNARLAIEAAALDVLNRREDGIETTGALRQALTRQSLPGIDPEDLWVLAEKHGYDVTLEVDPAAPFHFGAVLRLAALPPLSLIEGGLGIPTVPDLPWSAYANDPLAGKVARLLIPELREFLQEELPDYMVPASFVLLDRLPLNAHGKVDRAALPEPGAARSGARDRTLPRTPAEKTLAALWSEVLGIDDVRLEDNFFELGGHSLLATQLVSRVRGAFGVDLPLRRLFEKPALGELAAALEDGLAPVVAAPVHEERTTAPLSFPQELAWVLGRHGDPAFNMPSPLRILGPLDPDVLERCFREIFRRHEALRTRFLESDGVAVQRIDPPGTWWLPRVDLAGLPEALRQREAARLVAQEVSLPFDLARWPLMRVALARLSSGEHVLLLTSHHIVVDGWSMGVLTGELSALYRAFAAGEPSPLPELPLQYADLAVWQRERLSGSALQARLDWWRETLEGAPRLWSFPLDRPRPAVASHRGAVLLKILPPSLVARLKALGASEGASLYMTMLAALALVIHRWSGQDDVVVGSPLAGRQWLESERMIGFFLNVLPMRIGFSGEPAFRGLLRRARQTALDAFAHQEVPFLSLIEELGLPADTSYSPLFQCTLNMLNFPPAPDELPGDIRLEPLPSGRIEAKYDFTLYAIENGEGGLSCSLVYNRDLFERPRMEALLNELEAVLEEAH